MNKNLTITILLCFFVSSLFINSQANAGAHPPPPPQPTGSDCCFTDNMKCDVWLDSDDWCECDVMAMTKGEGKYLCEEYGPRYACVQHE